MKKAIVLLSGGLDSSTCLAYAKEQGFVCYALSFDYGQKHRVELEAAQAIATHFNTHHKIFTLDIKQFKGSALTDTKIPVPNFNAATDTIPITYVPARNTIFLSIALAWAEVLSAKDIFIGVSQVDYSGYPDCRPEFINAFQSLANLATKYGVEEGGIRIHTPLLQCSKAETIALGHRLGLDYSITISCYQADGAGRACGHCESCAYRKKGFVEAKVPDATRYQ